MLNSRNQTSISGLPVEKGPVTTHVSLCSRKAQASPAQALDDVPEAETVRKPPAKIPADLPPGFRKRKSKPSISGYLKYHHNELNLKQFPSLGPSTWGSWTHVGAHFPKGPQGPLGTFSFSQHHFFLPKDQPCFQLVSPVVGNGKQTDRK